MLTPKQIKTLDQLSMLSIKCGDKYETRNFKTDEIIEAIDVTVKIKKISDAILKQIQKHFNTIYTNTIEDHDVIMFVDTVENGHLILFQLERKLCS